LRYELEAKKERYDLLFASDSASDIPVFTISSDSFHFSIKNDQKKTDDQKQIITI